MPSVSPQLICFSYHKSGTSLLLHVMTRISQRLGLCLANHYGTVGHPDPEADIVLLPHSLLHGPLIRPFRGIRMIRDPRDIWVSGYLYHLRCSEGWCINTDLDPTSPIGWPRVDPSIFHWPEDAKRDYLRALAGRSYQANLQGRSRDDGLAFELDRYTDWTLAAMRRWNWTGPNVLDIRLEDVNADFDNTMRRIFDHFGFTPSQSEAALEVARVEDINRMDDHAIANRPQITSRTLSKWRSFLSVPEIAMFEARHADLIQALGYPLYCTGTAMIKVGSSNA